MNDTIGVDISKASLEVWRLSDRRHMRFSNDRDGLKALCQWLGSTPVRIVYEATGRFHRDLEGGTRAGQGQSLTGPPLRAGDRKHRQDRPRRRPDARAHGIDPGARADAGSQQEHARNQGAACRARGSDQGSHRLPEPAGHGAQQDGRHQLKARERQIDRQIAQIDAELVRLIKADPELARRYEIPMSIRGIGSVAATAMIVDMPELGMMTPKEAASLAGLAPVTRQSGSWKGKARIFGGRCGLRTLLFMPAVIATRYNAPLRKTYLALYEGGKPWKGAITAVMRKLIILANALIRDNRKWAEIAP